MKRTIGILALQGDFAEHRAAVERLGHEVVEVRLPSDLDRIDGLIIPGGESTTIGKLLVDFSLLEPLRVRVNAGLPVFGTCAGAIVLARDIGGLAQPLIGVMDIVIKRNAFGRQLQSFEANVDVPVLGSPPMHAIFIRAPAIEQVGPRAEVIARMADGTIVAARQGNLIATAFHPELTGDDRLHRYWLSLPPP